MQYKRVITLILSGAILSFLACFAAAALFHFSGDLVQLIGPALDLGKKETAQFSAAFGQLRSAVIRLPIIPTFILSVAASWLITSIRKPKAAAAGIILRLLLAMILFILIFLFALLLTKVNTICFANVLLSLLTLLTA